MPVPAQLDVTFPDDVLASVDTFSYDTTDAARPITSWTYLTDGATTNDAVMMSVNGTFTLDFGRWTVLLPGGATMAKLPALPDSLIDFRPNGTPSYTELVVMDSSAADYDQIRHLVTRPPRFIGSTWPPTRPRPAARSSSRTRTSSAAAQPPFFCAVIRRAYAVAAARATSLSASRSVSGSSASRSLWP
jgi:hypothetical protein